MDAPEEILINIIARLPLQSIVRFKLVCREWKTLTESAFFRDLFSSNTNSTTRNWSIMHGGYTRTNSSLEDVKLRLPRESSHGNLSLASVFPQVKEIRVVACTDGLVLLRLKPVEEDMVIRYYIGNPVLPQWILLPLASPPPRDCEFNDSGLVTRVRNGSLLGYKVVGIHRIPLKFDLSRTWSFHVFSSDTGEWSGKQVSFHGDGPGVLMFNTCNPVSLNGKLHWLDPYSRRILVHDFFSHDDQVRAICLPDTMQGIKWHSSRCRIGDCPSPCGKRICTTSQGYFVLIDAGLIDETKSYNVRVLRLKNDSWTWEKAWEINMACLGLGAMCVPMAINYFDIDIIYLWDIDRKCFLACNLRTHTKSYGARQDVYKRTQCFLGTNIPIPYGDHIDGVVYKADDFCFEPYSCLSQFVMSLQVVPT